MEFFGGWGTWKRYINVCMICSSIARIHIHPLGRESSGGEKTNQLTHS